MKIYLKNHDFRFAVEQTVMTLMPQESIETVEEEPDSLDCPQLISELDKNRKKAICSIKIQGEIHQGTCDVQETDLEDRSKIQYAIKESMFQAITSFQPPPPWGNLTGVRPVKLIKKILQDCESTGENPEEILQKKYHIDQIRREIALECGKVSLEIEDKLKNTVSIYLGIPFCPTRCHYCSFFSSDVREHQKEVQPYLDSLLQEVSFVANLLKQEGVLVSTLYVGGGTPTVLDEIQLEMLLHAIKTAFPLPLLEWTVEAGRPDTITIEKLKVLEKFGVSRISINPQTMSDEILKGMGRGHSIAQVKSIYSCAKDRFQINMDLICGLRGDSPEGFLNSLTEVIAMDPTQITVHSLTPKKNTPLTEGEEDYFSTISWEETLNRGWDLLKKAGYRPYYLYRQKKIADGLENVGWTKNLPSYYNVAMMEEFQTIVGLGAGSMTKWVGETGDIQRLQNPKFYWDYTKKLEENLVKKENFIKLHMK